MKCPHVRSEIEHVKFQKLCSPGQSSPLSEFTISLIFSAPSRTEVTLPSSVPPVMNIVWSVMEPLVPNVQPV